MDDPKVSETKASSLKFTADDDGLGSYLREIGKNKILTQKEERVLITRMRNGDKQAFKDLVTANLRFVVSVCRKFQHQGLPMTDLISEGNLGLIRAAQSFDETNSCRFISYAVWWIRQRILQALAEQSRFVSVPVGKAALLRKMAYGRRAFEQKKGRVPTPEELAEFLSIREREVLGLMEIGRTPMSLSEPTGGDDGGSGGGTLEDTLKDENVESPDQDYFVERRRKDVLEFLDCLKNLEREVLRLYFGFENDLAMTLEEISYKLNVSPERIRQIKESALRRLRHPSRLQKLREVA